MTKPRMLTWDEFKNMSGRDIALYHGFSQNFEMSEAIGKAMGFIYSSWNYDHYVFWYELHDTPLMKALA